MIKSEQYKAYQEQRKKELQAEKEAKKQKVNEVARAYDIRRNQNPHSGRPRSCIIDRGSQTSLIRQAILAGKSKSEVKQMYEEINLSSEGFATAYRNAKKYILEKQQQEVEEVLRDSLVKVKYILDEAILKQDFNLALKAVEVLNKCIGTTGKEVNILTQDTAIQIKFDD